MVGQPPRRRALEVLRECGIHDLPVDVEEVARRRGIAVRTVRTIRPGVFGAFFIEGAEAGILLSGECFSLGHRRFTLAHEIGHFLLDGHVEELLSNGSGQLFQSRYTCRGQCTDAGVTGTTFALDAGIQSQPVEDIPLRLGLLLAHIGPNLQLINVEQADPLPTRLRAAASYEVLRHFSEMPDVELWVTTELEDRWRDLGDPNLYLGGELIAGEGGLFLIRAGYGQQELGQSPGASVGLGLRYERFELGLAKRFSSSSVDGNPEPVHISFGVVF